ncbi:MAG: hypothetical protein CL879_00115 [Dehalococcoidia bacterium]|nr:hypothetical protein [Dehalococcoidia bacterium]
MSAVRVHCPAHITLLFSIHDTDNRSSHQGSRGAGFCVEAGVSVTAEISEQSSKEDGVDVSSQVKVWDRVESLIDHERESSFYSMYHDIAEHFRDSGYIDESDSVNLEVRLELPCSQGFGMSAAGHLAAAEAYIRVLEIDDSVSAAGLAHDMERRRSTGLGDVLAISAGGVELRLEPGAPPEPGVVTGFASDAPVLLVWSPGEGRHTSGYIDSLDWRDSISVAGEAAVERLRQGQWNADRWSELLEESHLFAEESGLLAEPERKALLANVNEAIEQSAQADDICACLCMLGVSAVIVPRSLESPVGEDILEQLGEQLRACGLGTQVTRIAPLQS